MGKSADFTEIDTILSAPPTGYESVHGVRSTPSKRTQFADDEYVVYNTQQQRMAYLVEFATAKDRETPQPPPLPARDYQEAHLQQHHLQQEMVVRMAEIYQPNYQRNNNFEEEPLLQEATAAENSKQEEVGLVSKSGASLPLKGVYVRAQLLGNYLSLLCL